MNKNQAAYNFQHKELEKGKDLQRGFESALSGYLDRQEAGTWRTELDAPFCSTLEVLFNFGVTDLPEGFCVWRKHVDRMSHYALGSGVRGVLESITIVG